MVVDAEQQKAHLLAQNEVEGHMFKMKDDPRITKIGKVLRKTSLDEFPQDSTNILEFIAAKQAVEELFTLLVSFGQQTNAYGAVKLDAT
ncbi:sugar transferase [Listeria booriae]|uniref:Sugar transferase n=1 Tax=Listeria booriae TaxID=1552123 RepID=A0A842FCK9_9LIST|nr:sugar transferase [Listeria booriae]MBC2245664.1 sugar transferase [Listeria booriae]